MRNRILKKSFQDVDVFEVSITRPVRVFVGVEIEEGADLAGAAADETFRRFLQSRAEIKKARDGVEIAKKFKKYFFYNYLPFIAAQVFELIDQDIN